MFLLILVVLVSGWVAVMQIYEITKKQLATAGAEE